MHWLSFVHILFFMTLNFKKIENLSMTFNKTFQKAVNFINTLLKENTTPNKNNSQIIKNMNLEKEIYEKKLAEEFFNNISHDLKTPITIILGYTQLLKERYNNNDEIHTIAIDYIESESKKLNLVIDEVIEIIKYSRY